jgi:hypothetical protein
MQEYQDVPDKVTRIIEACTSKADSKPITEQTDYERGMCAVRDAVFTYLLDVETNEKKVS